MACFGRSDGSDFGSGGSDFGSGRSGGSVPMVPFRRSGFYHMP